MATRIASASFLLSILFFSGAIVTADFDFFYYVLTWPGSFCKQNGCCLPTAGNKPELDFHIKGMYPAKNTGQIISKCYPTKFYINAVASLISDMNAYWPDIKCPSNNGRSNWKNLWETYGNCSGLTQRDYFTRVLEQRSKVNLLSKLRRAEIEPNGNEYSSQYVQAAINDAVGKKTVMLCKQTQDWCFFVLFPYPCTKYLLNEISFCTNKNATAIINCPKYPNSECGDKVTFNKFTYDMMKDTSGDFNPIQMPTYLSE